MDRRCRAFDPHQLLLLPPSLDDWLPQDHLARFVADLGDEVLDLTADPGRLHREARLPALRPQADGAAAGLRLHTGVRSSRAPEGRCADDIAFRFPAAHQAPDFRSVSRFRRRHLDALADLLTQSQSLNLAQKLSVLKMGRVALGGSKPEASASRHKAMSQGRLVDKEEQVETAAPEAQAQALLADAEATDEAEDHSFGTDGKDTDLPAELDRRRSARRSCRPPAHRPRPKPLTRPAATPRTRNDAARNAPAPATSRPSPTRTRAWHCRCGWSWAARSPSGPWSSVQPGRSHCARRCRRPVVRQGHRPGTR